MSLLTVTVAKKAHTINSNGIAYITRTDIEGQGQDMTQIYAIGHMDNYPSLFSIGKADAVYAEFLKDVEELGFIKFKTTGKSSGFDVVYTHYVNPVNVADFIKESTSITLKYCFPRGAEYLVKDSESIANIEDWIKNEGVEPEPKPVTILDFFHDKDGFNKAYGEFAESHK